MQQKTLLFMIKTDEIASKILSEMERGATFLKAVQYMYKNRT